MRSLSGEKQPNQRPEQQHEEEPEPNIVTVESLDKPSWIISGPKEAEEPNPGGPYGCVVIGITKRRTFGQVDVQIRDWQENRDEDVG